MSEGRRTRAAAWLVPPMMIGATLAGVLLVMRGPDRAFGIAAGSLFALLVGWVLASTLWPAHADRTCPGCGRESLQRLEPLSARGVTCPACGHVDPERSSFLMAEEEGPVEPIALAERRSG